jgi:hypothetical protein
MLYSLKQRQYLLTPLLLPLLRRAAMPAIAAVVGADSHHVCGFHRKLLRKGSDQSPANMHKACHV